MERLKENFRINVVWSQNWVAHDFDEYDKIYIVYAQERYQQKKQRATDVLLKGKAFCCKLSFNSNYNKH